MTEINDFIKRCQDWLLPLGYKEIFSDNHPDIRDFNIHFIKDAIRVCCRKRYDREECYAQRTIFKNETLVLQTGNYNIGTTDLDKMVDNLTNF